jgi:uncharacterized membrane protein
VTRPPGARTAGGRKKQALSQMSFLTTVFDLVEFLSRNTLTTTSKKLLITYLNEAREGGWADRARSTIQRYIQKELPSLEEIQEKSRTMELSKMDHLVLKMEHEARRLRQDELE